MLHTLNVVGGVWLLWTVLAQVPHQGNRLSQLLRLQLDFLERLALMGCATISIRWFAQDLSDAFAMVLAAPGSALAVAAGVAFFTVLVRLAPPLVKSGAALTVEGSTGPRPAKDIHRTAVHEVGHVLLHADLVTLPARLSVEVVTRAGAHTRVTGAVQRSNDEFLQNPTKESLHWLMLMLLAGSEAEFAVLGDRASGAGPDLQWWLTTAHGYLSTGFGEVFYTAPVGAAQIEHNRIVLNALKARQVLELSQRFCANLPLLTELAEKLADQKKMDKAELVPYLKRIVAVAPSEALGPVAPLARDW